jgi:hypothetical protein
MKIGKWKRRVSPKESGAAGQGWFSELSKAWSDGKYAVMIRDVETEWGRVQHACIRNVSSTGIPWAEKQRIKNELFGENAVAIEVFPKVSELVDEANMYHLWILPEGFELPFGLHKREGRG